VTTKTPTGDSLRYFLGDFLPLTKQKWNDPPRLSPVNSVQSAPMRAVPIPIPQEILWHLFLPLPVDLGQTAPMRAVAIIILPQRQIFVQMASIAQSHVPSSIHRVNLIKYFAKKPDIVERRKP
jgi:hypothetical protein